MGNVPLNEDLAAETSVAAASAADARFDFEDDWNRLNLMRTFAIIGSFAALLAATTLTDAGTRRPSARSMDHA